jgi:uncharacterized protein
MWIQTLTTSECMDVLNAQRLAHLACANEGRPYVVPIYYCCADKALYAFSMQGRKIDIMRANPLVSAIVEAHEKGPGWKSVIVEGRYEELPERIGFKRQRDHAWSLLSKHANWWEPGALNPTTPPSANDAAHVFFRILIEEISGRAANE